MEKRLTEGKTQARIWGRSILVEPSGGCSWCPILTGHSLPRKDNLGNGTKIGINGGKFEYKEGESAGRPFLELPPGESSNEK